MSASGVVDLIIGTETVVILILMAFNTYFLSQRRILARIREIYFINSRTFRQSWYLVICATTFFLIIQILSMLSDVGTGPSADDTDKAITIFQLSFGTLILVAFGLVFSVFVKYIHHLNEPDASIDAAVVEDMRRAMMRDDTQLDIKLDLSQVGDVYTARRRLGPNVSLGHYRAMAIGFATYMQEKLGHVGDAILYSVGRLTARQVAEEIFRDVGSEALALPRIFAEMRNQGIALPEVTQRTHDRVDLVLQECATSAGIKPIGRAVCHYQTGMLSGIFEGLTGRRCVGRETKCWGLGDQLCEFRIDFER